MQTTIKVILAGIVFLLPVVTHGADTRDLRSQVYGIWEVDAKDIENIIKSSKEPNKSRNVSYEFSEKNITVNIVDLSTGKKESTSKEIWWIFLNGNIYFTYGKRDNRIVLLDRNTMRVEFDDKDESRIIMRRSSAAGVLATTQREQEVRAVSAIKSYATAQVTFQAGRQGRNPQNTNSGTTGFADNFRNLYYGFPMGDENSLLQLISKGVADAFRVPPAGAPTVSTQNNQPGESKAYYGYFFVDDQACDYSTDFSIFAIPESTSSASKAFWVGQQGTVYFREIQPGENIEHPRDPSSKWMPL